MTKLFAYTLFLEEPVIVTDGSSEGQQHFAMDYISGTSLLGAFIHASGISTTDPLFRDLFLSNRCRFLNAYPMCSGLRGLPLPRSFAFAKTNKKLLVDRALNREQAEERLKSNDTNKPTVKGVKDIFAVQTEPDALEKIQVEKLEMTHVGIDIWQRRAKDGILFTYESIAPRQNYGAYIICEDSLAHEVEENLLSLNTLHIGRSRATGYGRVQIESVQLCDTEVECVYKSGSRDKAVLTLLSDYIPAVGQSIIDSLSSELANYNINLDENGEVYADTREVAGFRGIWGLPRHGIQAFLKGSVFTITCNDNSSVEQLMLDGIGNRRNEGFGRVAVNWTLHDHEVSCTPKIFNLTTTTISEEKSVILGNYPNQELPVNMQLMEHILKQRKQNRLRTRSIESVLQSKKMRALIESLSKTERPTNNQLGNLRNVASGANSIGEVQEWFNAMLKKTPGSQWKLRVPSLLSSNKNYLSEVIQNELLCDVNNLIGELCDVQVSKLETDQEIFQLQRDIITGLVGAVVMMRNTNTSDSKEQTK